MPAGAGLSGRLWLVVLTDGAVSSYPVPEEGALTIGRAPSNDVAINDPSLSRSHAVIHAGPAGLSVEDLGSQNGTVLGGQPLESGERRPLLPGFVVEVGKVMVVVQRSDRAVKPRRLWSHAYFEARLEEECWRGPSNGFLVVRVHTETTLDPLDLADALHEILGPADVAATYAGREYELLLVDTPADEAESVEDAVREAFGGAGAVVRVGVAAFGVDGRTPDALLGKACADVVGGTCAPVLGESIIIEDQAMRDLHRIAERVARGTISVLLLGETGAGKEILAQAIHRYSPRADAPFVSLNCAALSQTLLESELFGYEKGAFTGADTAKAGLLESANGGTVFLDELGELPAEIQAKLLRVIEQRQVLRVGSVKSQPIDVRFVSATNRDLEAETSTGGFRADLFYRLNGVVIRIPPLRERPNEIGPLTRIFLVRAAEDLGLVVSPRLTPRALEQIKAYQWPGNIRELRNVIERAVLLTTSDMIDVEHLPLDKMRSAILPEPSAPVQPSTPADPDDERARIVNALETCVGNQTRAARLLGIARGTLIARMDKYNLPRPRKK